MDAPAHSEASLGDVRALESLLAFWADAGVDTLYGDTTHDRLASREVAVAPSIRSRGSSPVATPSADDPPPATAMDMRVARARAVAAEAHDLVTLATAAETFATPRATRFMRGAVDPEVILVCDGPDDEDLREGVAFGGAKGRLLDRVLTAAGLGGRTLILPATLRSAGNTSAAEEERLHAVFLDRAINLVRPRAVIASGPAAARAFFAEQAPILKLRGRWTTWGGPQSETPVPVLATLSPSLLLDHPAAKRLAWRDILTLVERLEPAGPSDLA